MLAQELQETLPSLNNATVRYPGIHVSQLIQELGMELNIPPYNKDMSLLNTYGPEFCALGFVWERNLELAWKDMLGIRPPELIVDGIAMNPDGVNFHTYPFPCIEEYKCSWSNCNKSPDQEWRYKVQSMAYCRAINVKDVVFRILYVCGNYRPQFPVYKTWRITFTQEELDINWNMLVNFANKKGYI